MLSRFALVSCLCLIVSTSCSTLLLAVEPSTNSLTQVSSQALSYLLENQKDDGGWGSGERRILDSAHGTLGIVSAIAQLPLSPVLRQQATNSARKAFLYLRSTRLDGKANGSAEAYLRCIALAYSTEVLGLRELDDVLPDFVQALQEPVNLEAKLYQLMFAMSTAGLEARRQGLAFGSPRRAEKEFEVLDASLPHNVSSDLRLTMRLALYWSKTTGRPLLSSLPALWEVNRDRSSTKNSSQAMTSAGLHLVTLSMSSFRNVGPTSGPFWPLSSGH